MSISISNKTPAIIRPQAAEATYNRANYSLQRNDLKDCIGTIRKGEGFNAAFKSEVLTIIHNHNPHIALLSSNFIPSQSLSKDLLKFASQCLQTYKDKKATPAAVLPSSKEEFKKSSESQVSLSSSLSSRTSNASAYSTHSSLSYQSSSTSMVSTLPKEYEIQMVSKILPCPTSRPVFLSLAPSASPATSPDEIKVESEPSESIYRDKIRGFLAKLCGKEFDGNAFTEILKEINKYSKHDMSALCHGLTFTSENYAKRLQNQLTENKNNHVMALYDYDKFIKIIDDAID